MFQWDAKTIENITEYIQHRVTSVEEASAAIESLHNHLIDLDWKNILEKERIRIEEILNEVVPCARCNKGFPRRELNHIINSWPSFGLHCSECSKAAYEECHPFCVVCEQRFHRTFGSWYFCKNCKTEELLKEASRVVSHNSRANSLGILATLTVKQWITTLKYFDWKCAYCAGTYKCLEHYIPLPYEGTTQTNCFPACTKCNHIKKDKLPEQFERLFPTENIKRIKEYIVSKGCVVMTHPLAKQEINLTFPAVPRPIICMA